MNRGSELLEALDRMIDQMKKGEEMARTSMADYEEQFLVTAGNSSTGLLVSLPCATIESLFSASTPPGLSYQKKHDWNEENNAEFNGRIANLLRETLHDRYVITEYQRQSTTPSRKVVYSKKEVTAPAATKQKESKMSSFQDITKQALIRGGEKALINQGAELFLKTFENMVDAELASQILGSEQGRNLVKAAMAMLYLAAAQNIDKLPMNDGVEKICSSLIEVSTQSFVESNAAALVDHIPAFLSEISSLGKKMEEGQFLDIAADLAALQSEEKVEEVEIEEVEELEVATSDSMRFR